MTGTRTHKKNSSNEDSNPDPKNQAPPPSIYSSGPPLTHLHQQLAGRNRRAKRWKIGAMPPKLPPTPASRLGVPGPSSPPGPRLRPPPKGPSSVPPRPGMGSPYVPQRLPGGRNQSVGTGGAECSTSSSCKKCTHSDITNAITRVVEGCQTGRPSLVAARITSTTRLPSPKAQNEVLPPRGLKELGRHSGCGTDDANLGGQ